MRETVYIAGSELRRPRHFLATAMADLKRSGWTAWRLFGSNLRVRYRKAWLGYLWLILPAFGTAAICTLIQRRNIVAIAPTELPYPVFVLAGMIFWQLFLEALHAPLQQLTANRQIVTRSRVPHEAIILAGVAEAILNCAARFVVLLAALAVFAIYPAPSMLLIPLGMAALTLLGLAIGMLLAPAGLLYDDVNRALTLITGFWLFLTPVLYPLPADGLLRLNPVAPLLETTRSWLTGGGIEPGFWAVSAISLAGLILAWLLYRLARPHVVGRLG